MPGSGPVVKDIYFINSSAGFICGNNTIKSMKATNGSMNWTVMPNLPTDNNTYNTVHATGENHIFLGVDADRKIVKTTNGGVSWTTQILPGTTYIEIHDIEFQNANTGYAGGDPTYFAYTTNGGTNWVQSIYPNNQMGVYSIKTVGSTVYTLGSYQSIYYSTNFGASWNTMNYYDASNPYQENPFLMFGMDIRGGNFIVVGLRGLMNISNDGGTTWRNKNYSVGKNNYTYYSIYAESGSGKIWASGSSSGIMYSSNGGNNWTIQNSNIVSGTALRSIQMVNSATGYCVGGNMTLGQSAALKTTNGGATWNNLTLPTTHEFKEVKFINANTGWVWGGIGGFISPQITIAKTTNGGSSWVLQPTIIGYHSVITHADMADANTGFCISDQYVFKTTNGGAMWNQVIMPNTEAIFADVVMLSPSNVILISKINDHNLYKSIDGGTTWEIIPAPNNVNQIFAMDWTDQYNRMITGAQGYTAKTSDGGYTWQERNPGSSTIPAVFMTSKDTVFAAVTEM